MQWKRNAGREQGGELNWSLDKRKKKKYDRLLSSRPAELPLLAEPARRACFTAVKSHVTSIWKYHCIHFFAAAQRLISGRHPSFSEPNILLRYFCILWITGAVKIFTWAQNHLEREGKNPSKVPAAFYPVSASKMFRRNWRYEKSSFHYWQWKPLRHFRCFIAFN